MEMHWLVLVPPLLVIVLATFTRRIMISLFLGIISASLIINNFLPIPAIKMIIKRMWDVTELGLLQSWECLWSGSYIFICLFLLILGILIELIIASGAAFAYGNAIKKRLSSARSIELSTLFMTHLFFIDDYFNSLTVGSVMRPITDQFSIPRIRLGLIINTVAAPLAVIVPISSWVADVVIQLRQAGVASLSSFTQSGTQCAVQCVPAAPSLLINADAFTLFLAVIPFVFYSFIQIISLWFFISKRLSFGILRVHAREAEKSGNLFGGKIPVIERRNQQHNQQLDGQERTLVDFLFPLCLLFGLVMAGVLWLGAGKMALVLCAASALTTVISMLYFLMRKRLSLCQLGHLVIQGIMATAPSVMVLVLIWTMSSLLRYDLQTGKYLASVLIGRLPLTFLPVMFFVVGSLISSLMGSAWGAIGILVSIALPMLASYIQAPLPATLPMVPMLMPLVGALISGALVANHCSPIADILLMSATSSGSYHLDLIKAQITYCLSGLVITAGMFLLAGLIIESVGVWVTSFICIFLGIILNCLLLQFMHNADRG